MSFGDITSANVVGYNQVQLRSYAAKNGKCMVGACFIKVGTEQDVKLSELKITGYENSAEYLGQMGFSLSFQRRADNGMPFATYIYTDSSDDCATWNGGWWEDLAGNVINADNDVTLTAGDGLWFDTPALADCSAFYLQTSGQVLNGDQAFELTAGIKQGVCNMLPTSTSISKIEIHGYEDSSEYLGQMGFCLTMQSLGDNGMPLVTYIYTDSSDDCATWNGGWWEDNSGNVIDSDNDVVVGAGEGFWVDAPALEDCALFTMVFPGCL